MREGYQEIFTYYIQHENKLFITIRFLIVCIIPIILPLLIMAPFIMISHKYTSLFLVTA